MKKRNFLILFLGVMILFVPSTSWAQKDPSRVTAFNGLTDFFATIGKSTDEKRKIIQQRRQYRRDARMFKDRQRTKKKKMKTIQGQNQAILDKIKVRKYPSGRRDKVK